MLSVFTGFLAGVIHVWSGPDHLAALAPLSVEHPERAQAAGLRWGLGHAAGVTLVGVLAVLLRGLLPLDWLSSWAERLVGVVLIGIGLWGLRKAFTNQVHTHAHAHGGRQHVHIHVHGRRGHHEGAGAHDHTHAAFAVGALHGVAGGSHVWGVLPALAFPTHSLAFGYLAAYGLGTVLAMAVFSTLVGLAAARFHRGGPLAYRAMMVGCSAPAVLLGGYWLVA
jgi:hypothetical protein